MTPYPSLFSERACQIQVGSGSLHQFFTPGSAATALVEEFFGELSADDRVLKPPCGRDAFLKAVPKHIRATGVSSYCPGNRVRSFAHQGEAILLRHESSEFLSSFKHAAAFFWLSHTIIAHYAHSRRRSRVGKLTIVGR